MRRWFVEVVSCFRNRWSLLFLVGTILAAIFSLAGSSVVARNALLFFSTMLALSVFWHWTQNKPDAHFRRGGRV